MPRTPVADRQDVPSSIPVPNFVSGQLIDKDALLHSDDKHESACKNLPVSLDSYLQSSRHLGPHLGLTANRSRKPGGVGHDASEVTSCCCRFE